MKVELRREMYDVTYEALDWLCIAEKLSDLPFCGGWPEEHDYEREAVVSWAKAVYEAAVTDRQRITLSMPRDWTWWLLRMLTDAHLDDEFPWMLQPQLVGQIKRQNQH